MVELIFLGHLCDSLLWSRSIPGCHYISQTPESPDHRPPRLESTEKVGSGTSHQPLAASTMPLPCPSAPNPHPSSALVLHHG